ncbi:hypothetical protein Q4Q34_18795 [Flavivirga abyssicola]|uniref:hypothetical protein n=1 Tax=Flavivirga abyssicola TaxID=3063533 RepID=UPI0026DF762C|nr:hypothetical protein [Flavivirga sp. MEBiC07777]WVK13265.1 hypothetical protein Q4Q34_18795 [Flavivirga sp. MEBiC07777]
MKQFYFVIKRPYFLSFLFIQFSLIFVYSQSVTVSDNTPGESPTYTFTYVTAEAIGAGSNTSNIFYMTLPNGFPSITNIIDYPTLLDSNIILKVNGNEKAIDETTFGPIGGSWSNGIQMSTLAGSPGLTIPAGSTIEIIVTGIIINPSVGDYTITWRTASSNGTATEWYSAAVKPDVLPAMYAESGSKVKSTNLYGKRILEKEIDNNDVSQLVLSDFKIATYILQVEGSQNSIAYKKLVRK